MKKYFEKFKDLKSTNKKLYYATICMFVLVGFTFAYVIDQISGGAISRVFITADTSDTLEFNVDKDILIKPTQFNFTQGGVDLSDTATATARLKANSTDNTASYKYNVYLQILTNEYIYTTEDHKPEMILQVTNPNGENVTKINGLVYYDDLQGFDITSIDSLITITENYEITSNSSANFTIQNWKITVKFINLDTNQIDNEGKTLEGKILIQRNKEYRNDISFFGLNYEPAYIEGTSVNCVNASAIWNSKYSRLEVGEITGKKPSCTLSSAESSKTKKYLNNYIIGLSGTIQGIGNVIHETFYDPIFTNAINLSNSEYGAISQYYSSLPANTSGTTVTNAFSYNNNEWTNHPNNLTSNNYYHFSFSLSEGSYYQLCYEMSASSSTNTLYFYKEERPISVNGSITVTSNTTSSTNGCINLKYISESTKYRVVQRTGTSNAMVKFYVQKTDNANVIDTGYRYEGKNPNNYVWFNNELWRIIGVFENNGEYLTKIIRNDSIGSLVYDYRQQNDYAKSTLMNLLNGSYLNSEDGTESGYCYNHHNPWGGTEYLKTNCDYRINGIRSNYKSMIKTDANWYLGGISKIRDPNTIYMYERDNNVYVGNNIIWKGAVGLMYPSDFAYSVLASSCSRDYALSNNGSYGTDSCSGSSWLFGLGSEWLLSVSSRSNSNALNIREVGTLSSDNSVGFGLNVRPTVYLKNFVYLKSGNGSINSPYIVEM